MRTASQVLAIAVIAASASAQTPTLDAAAAALGGKDKILAVRTLVLEGTGDWPSYGQNHTPEADTRFEVTAFRRSYDFPNRRWFFDQTRVARFTAANMAPQRVRFGVDGIVAYNVGANGSMTRGSAQVAADRAMDLVLHPVGFVQRAYAAGAQVTEQALSAGLRSVKIMVDGGTYTMVVDTRTNLPVRVERMTYLPMAGDVMLTQDLGDWRDASGVKLPMRMTLRLEAGGMVQNYRITRSELNGDVGNIAATDSIRAVILPPPAAPAIVVDTLAPGVWLIAGQTHHTVAIEQSNQIVLVEAPQNEARTLAAIAAARQLRPGKAPTWVINTHHHFDHSGGFRAAVSQGLGVITQVGNRDFYERVVFARKHTILQDELAKNPKPLRLMTVGDRHVLRDSMRTIEVHHVAGNAHNGAMLMVYLPVERILIQADLYAPPAANAPAPVVFPFAGNLLDNIQRRGLAVDRVVGIHGRAVPLSDIQSAARTP